MKKKIILNSSERAVLELLWESSPQTMTELYHGLNDSHGWSKSTVNTMLARMLDKKIITYKQGDKAKLYKPVIKKKDADMAETESLIDRIYNGSVSMMMSSLVSNKGLSDEEKKELRDMLDNL